MVIWFIAFSSNGFWFEGLEKDNYFITLFVIGDLKIVLVFDFILVWMFG